MNDFAEFSPAARRVLTAMVELARTRGTSPLVADALVALWEDESHAAEWLHAAAETVDELQACCAASLDARDLLLRLTTEARQLARQSGRTTDVGTEHLLGGLLLIAPDLAEELEARGVDVPALLHGTSRQSAVPQAPLPVDAASRLSDAAPQESATAARMLDAAANRCREGLRVIEDYVRFALDDAVLCLELKHIRHGLAAALSQLGAENWILDRDTPGDVGAARSIPSERLRISLDHVVQANAKRVEESLRTLEELGKLTSPHAAAGIETLRYRFYAVEQAVGRRRQGNRRLSQSKLYLLLTDRLCPRGLGPVATAACGSGADIVQLREKDVADRRHFELSKRLREWTRAAGVLLIVNDRPDLAALVDADGVHLGQGDLPLAAARRIVGAQKLIGISTHTIEQARDAVLAGADYLGVGPVFPSATKSFDECAGLEFVRQAAAEIRIPWFAIGGITIDNVAAVREAGAARIAVSAAICGAADPAGATRELASRIRGRGALDGAAIESPPTASLDVPRNPEESV